MPPKSGPRPGKSDLYRIGGVDIPYDPDLGLDKPRPTPLYPEYKVHTPKPLTDAEKEAVEFQRSFRERARNGPLYTILDDNARVRKPGDRVAASFDPFNGMPKYSSKYMKKKRTLPDLTTRPHILKFFPKELWSTLDPTATETDGVIQSNAKGKSLDIPGYKKLEDAEDKSDGEGEQKPPKDLDEDEALEEEEMDDEYDDDDEDGGGDYNAEQYFDDGGDDAGDDYDGGDDGGGGGDWF